MTRPLLLVTALSAGLAMAGPAAKAQNGEAAYRISLTDTGLRDYYCTITVTLENLSTEPLADINGHFFNYIGEEMVGRSKGASFRDVDPGASTTATFETPHAPCDDVERYRFVVGACLKDGAFVDRAACASDIEPMAPITEAVAR